MKLRIYCLFFVFILPLFIACKPGVENEIKKYNVNQTRLKGMAAKYPEFYSLLVIVSQKAAKLVEESKKISDKDNKAKKIAEANSVFSDTLFYRQLDSYSGRKERIMRLQVELQSYRKREHRVTVENAIKAANNALSEAGKIIKDTRLTNAEEAGETVKNANGILISAEGKLNRAKKKIIVKKKKK